MTSTTNRNTILHRSSRRIKGPALSVSVSRADSEKSATAHTHTHNPSSLSSSFSLHCIFTPQTAQTNHALALPQKPDKALNVSAAHSSIRSAASKLYFLRPRDRSALHCHGGETVESLALVSAVSDAPCTLPPDGIFIINLHPNPAALLVRSLDQGLRLEFPKKNFFLGLGNREVSLSRIQVIM